MHQLLPGLHHYLEPGQPSQLVEVFEDEGTMMVRFDDADGEGPVVVEAAGLAGQLVAVISGPE